MSWQVIMAILLILVATVAVLMRVTSKNPAGRARAMRVAVIAGGLAIIVLILGSTTIVSTRNIGVVTTFGRPEGTLSNGLHWKAPWQSVTEMNGAIQIDDHTGEMATTVRLANNSTAFVDFDPLAPENAEGTNVQALGDEVAEKLRTKVGDGAGRGPRQ